MFIISDNALKEKVYSAFSSRTREFRQRLSFGEGVGENFSSSLSFYKGIKKIEISQIGNADNNGIVLGNCCSSSAVVEFFNPKSKYSYNGKTMFVECGIKLDDGEFYYIPCGYYKVEKPETDDNWHTVKVTAYDDIDKMSEKWNTNLPMPTTSYLLIKELADKYELEIDVDSSTLSLLSQRTITESEAIELTAYKEREVIGILAGCIGGNARINTVGKLYIGVYDFSSKYNFEISPEVQWQNGFKKTLEKAFVITSITSGVDDKVFTAGTGNGISFVNPIITEDEITAIRRNFLGKEFQPSSCEWRGNPCIECGDVISVSDDNGFVYSVIVARQDIDLTGGLSTITHCPSGDAEISFDSVDERTRKALNKQYTNLQQAIVDATNKINGALGGYYEVLDKDNDGNPDEWLIKEYEDGHGGLIRANKEGIGLSNDGGVTYRTAITYSGINADEIVTGKIKAELIDTSALVVGGGSYEDLDSLLNVIVDTTNSSITKVDVLYGKNQSTTTPPTSWSTNAPVWQNGYYIWTKTQTTAGGVTSETQPVCITGAKGEQGKTGATGSAGANGQDGVGISSIVEEYYLSSSSTTQTGGSWSTNQPSWSSGKYIWTRSYITWEDGSTDTTTPVLAKAINGANQTATTANNTANEAKTTANSVDQTILDWCMNNNKTYINGAKIYTGSITADQIKANAITAEKLDTNALNIGYQSENLANGWHNPNNLNFDTYFTATKYDDKYELVLKTNYTSGTIRCSSSSFNLKVGETVKFGGTIYNRIAKATGLYLELKNSDGSWTVKRFTNNSATGSHNLSLEITVEVEGEYRLTYALDNQYSGCYCSGVYLYRSRGGTVNIKGTIFSADHKTYFDLDNAVIYTKSDVTSSKLSSGTLEFGYADEITGRIQAFSYDATKTNRSLQIQSPVGINIGVGNGINDYNEALLIDKNGISIKNNFQVGQYVSLSSTNNSLTIFKPNNNDKTYCVSLEFGYNKEMYRPCVRFVHEGVVGWLHMRTDGNLYWNDKKINS